MAKGCDWDVVIVGAGVVGLACAALVARPGRRVLVVERHDGICREGSSRNSEVVHAGLYYPAESLKARSCVEGRRALYDRCERMKIPFRKCGKLIVATEMDQLSDLEELKERGTTNGVEGLRLLNHSEFSAIEPEVRGLAALYSPESGIVDSHSFARSYEVEAIGKGATVALRTELVAAEVLSDGYRVELRLEGEPEPFSTTSRTVINAAGLGQDRVSALVGLDVDAAGYRQHWCKGDWFNVAPRHHGRLSSLIYPVGRASDAGLGIHSCMDMGGGLRLGPDAEWVDDRSEHLMADEGKRHTFWVATSKLFPWLEEDDLSPDQAGLRPKLSRRTGEFRDFVVEEESDKGLPGWITLAGIESPGLTASPALAEQVAALLEPILS